MRTYLNVPISFARIAMLVVALISVCVFGHSASSQTKTPQDVPVGVKYDKFFQPGEVKIEPFRLEDLTDLPPLPAGYVALNNQAYRVTTTAIVAGEHTIRFAVPSVSDEDVFKKLLILYADDDPYDPDGHVWRDVTVFESATGKLSMITRWTTSLDES